MDLVSQIKALNKIGIALTSETNLQKLMELILEEARELTNADGGSLYLKEKDKLTFYVTQNKTLNDRENFCGGFKHHTLPISKESIAGFAAITGEILTIKDAYKISKSAPYNFNYDFDKENEYRTRSVLVVPLMTPDEDVVGVLQLINATDEREAVISFPEDVIPLAKSLASQAAVALRNARLIYDIKKLLKSIIQFSASAIDARSPHTAGHSRRVAEYSRAIAEAISQANSGTFADVFFTPDELEELYYSAWLHDIGKIGIPESVLDKHNKVSRATLSAIKSRFELASFIEMHRQVREDCNGGDEIVDMEAIQNEIMAAAQNKIAFIERINTSNQLSNEEFDLLKELAESSFNGLDGGAYPYLDKQEFVALAIRQGNLTDQEYKKIQSHVVHTQKIIQNIPFPEYLENVPLYASSHHEMVDGSGYPKGLKGDELPLQSRILAVVDIFDALTAVDRPYRKSMSAKKAIEFLQDEVKKGRLDVDVVDIFVRKKLYESILVKSKEDYLV